MRAGDRRGADGDDDAAKIKTSRVIRGLTRVSINPRTMRFSKRIDCRVKPGNDENVYSAACCATVGCVPATVARRMSRGCDWS